VNEFVEECRRQWERLGVPDPVANEMAADLAADLQEAEAEGASAEEVLGSGAFDPRSFATTWAAERGIIRRTPPSARRLPGRSLLPAAIAAFAPVVIIGAILLILDSGSTSERLALASPSPRELVVAAPPPPEGVWVTRDLPSVRIVTVGVDTNGSSLDTRTVGLVLLIVGLAGIVPLTLFWLWTGNGRWSRRRTRADDLPTGPAY
jgi:hypothetical protein